MAAIDLDTPLMSEIREHLLRLSRSSFEPLHGGRRAQLGSPEEDAVVARFRPFAELLLLVASADGQVDSQERAVILGAFRALTGGRVRAVTLDALEAELTSKIQGADPLDLLEGVCARLAGDRRDAELALTLASAVATADSKVDTSEASLIEILARWLRIEPERARELVSGPIDQA